MMHLDETRHRNKTFSPERLEQKSQKTTVCFQCFDILLQIIHWLHKDKCRNDH